MAETYAERVPSPLREGLEFSESAEINNGPTCQGVVHSIVGSENDFSEIEIIGRYPPEAGTYSTNNGSQEIVDIEEGCGWLYRLSNTGFLSEERLSPGRRVVIEKGEHFAWLSQPPAQEEPEVPEMHEGMTLDKVIAQALEAEAQKQKIGMKLAMLCVPGFNPEKYISSRTEEEILQAYKKEGDK